MIGGDFDPTGGATFIVPLQRGFCPFRVLYFHRKGGRNLAPVYIKPEGQDDSPIPLNRLQPCLVMRSSAEWRTVSLSKARTI